MNKIRNVEVMFGTAVGAFAVYKTQPILKEMQLSYPIFRKSWMRFPIPIAVFSVAYHMATMLPQKLGRKASIAPSVTHDVYTGKTDLVGRFRFYESTPIESQENKVACYASTYSTEALTQPEILSKIANSGSAEPKA